MCILYPLAQIPSILDGSKFKTARKPTFAIKTGKERAFVNNMKLGAFGWGFIESAEVVHIDSFDDKLARELGSPNLESYLANGWNSEFDSRKVIEWSDFRPNEDVLRQILG